MDDLEPLPAHSKSSNLTSMKKLTATLCLTIAVLLGSEGVSWGTKPLKNYCRLFTKDLYLKIAGKCSSAYERGDYATALREWKPLAKQGNASAQFNLGMTYANGRGVPQDYKTAVKWYKLAAKQGLVDAQYTLGVLYANGQGVPQDYKTAVKWYELAAEQGDVSAQFYLGHMYHYGHGVPQDHKTAVKWYRLAAEQGNAFAQLHANTLERRIAEQKHSPPAKSAAEKEVEKLRKRIAALEKERESKPKQIAKKPPPKKALEPKSGSIGSGFFISKLGHIVTNEHVVRECGSVTVGDNANKQVRASVLETD